MLSRIGVSLVVAPYAIAKLIIGSRAVRLAAVLTMIAYVSSRNYRPGEGPLSVKMSVVIEPGDGMGGVLYDLSEQCNELRDFRGATFRLTKSEASSLGILVQASFNSPAAFPALVDFLSNFPRRI